VVDVAERLRPGVFWRTAHRGGAGLAPENTLVAFERAAACGVDALELDVRPTRDGEVAVIHDATLDRTTDGRGLVSDRTAAELARLDAGARFTLDGGVSFPFRGRGHGVPLLREVLEALPAARFVVELKPPADEAHLDRVARLLRELAPGRVVVGCFAHGLLSAFRARAPEVPTGCSVREIRGLFLLGRVPLIGRRVAPPARVVQIPRTSNHETGGGLRLTTPSFLRFVHGRGLPVQVWTINDPAVMRELIDLGVDGITTDRPDLLNAALGRAPAEA